VAGAVLARLLYQTTTLPASFICSLFVVCLMFVWLRRAICWRASDGHPAPKIHSPLWPPSSLWSCAKFEKAIPPSRQQSMSNCGCASGDERAFEDDGEARIGFDPLDR
jgi:hypothetical protein